MMQKSPDRENVTALLPRWCRRYVALASAKLGVSKAKVITDALNLHREYLVGAGVFKANEVEE
jgi:hypothetical protein